MHLKKTNTWAMIAIIIICVPIGYVGAAIIHILNKRNEVVAVDSITTPNMDLIVSQASAQICSIVHYSFSSAKASVIYNNNPPVAVVVESSTHTIGNYAIWTGKMKNGKPHGAGSMTFISSHAIDELRTAQAGDYIDNAMFENGELQYGRWRHKDGSVVEQIDQ